LSKYNELKICSPYSFLASKENESFNADIIIICYSITNIKNLNTLIINNDLNLPLYIILNKEYERIDEKLEWSKKMNPKKCFSVHHDVELFQEKTEIPFTRIMWSADHDIFKKYDELYKYDLFFSGVIREEQTCNLRNKIYSKINELESYNLLLRVAFFKNDILQGKLYPFNNLEYANRINHSKICLVTTGPGDLVGTRYFEVAASNKSLILCNRMIEKIYENFAIDKFNCVMFDDENDFIQKFKYYIENEKERLNIVNNAYNHFKENLSWDCQIKYLISNL
jgi:spore maturation protein CgeB